MDAWSHLVFALTFAILVDVYPIEKMKGLFTFAIVIEIINALVATLGYDYYNALGVVLRGPFLGYILFMRLQSNDENEKAQLERLAVLLFTAVYLAAASHNLDTVIDWAGYAVIQKSVRRGHNIWHTPFAALIITLVFVSTLFILANSFSSKYAEFKLFSSFNLLYLAGIVGYVSHILADFLVYDFAIYWFYPLNDSTFSIFDLIGQGKLTKAGTPEKPEGTTYFWATPFFIVVFLFIVLSKQRLSQKLRIDEK